MTHQSKVSITKAAELLGIGRSTLYKHIDEKGISVEGKDTPRPKIDVSELIRVYGSRVKTPEQLEEEKQKSKLSEKTLPDTSLEEKIELQTLREKVKYLELLHSTEKGRLEDQIEMLRDMLDSEKEERRKPPADHDLVAVDGDKDDKHQMPERLHGGRQIAEGALHEAQDDVINGYDQRFHILVLKSGEKCLALSRRH